MHGNKGIIFTNRDARKYIEIQRNTLDIFKLRAAQNHTSFLLALRHAEPWPA
jgi:3-deoxy-D-arabino-heptulosonate 7-phosphate (DAHP) synthase